MPRFLLLCIASASLAVFAEDLLLDDFDSGTGKNRLGLDWYYYSDVNDSGNSMIHEATELPGGAYSPVVIVAPDDGSGRCAQLKYTLGDSLAAQGDLNAFVGIGTDMAETGKTVDLSTADSISFLARAESTIAVIIDFVAESYGKNCSFAFYSATVIVDDDWKRFVIELRNIEQPIWVKVKCEKQRLAYLSDINKINWRIKAITECYVNGGYSTYNENGSSGYFLIDDVVIHGVDSIPEFKSVTTISAAPAPVVSQNHGVVGMFDIMGRKCSPSTRSLYGPGLLIRQCGVETRTWLDITN